MLDISGKTFYTLLMNMLNRVSESVNKREGSLIRTSLAAAAWAIEGIYIDLAYIQKQAFALFAEIISTTKSPSEVLRANQQRHPSEKAYSTFRRLLGVNLPPKTCLPCSYIA